MRHFEIVKPEGAVTILIVHFNRHMEYHKCRVLLAGTPNSRLMQVIEEEFEGEEIDYCQISFFSPAGNALDEMLVLSREVLGL